MADKLRRIDPPINWRAKHNNIIRLRRIKLDTRKQVGGGKSAEGGQEPKTVTYVAGLFCNLSYRFVASQAPWNDSDIFIR